MKRQKRITRKQKKVKYGSEAIWRRARREKLRKETAMRLNYELNGEISRLVGVFPEPVTEKMQTETN